MNTEDNKTKKVLIVEDEGPLANAVRLKLEKTGFDVERAGDGVQALEILENTEFDIILLDLLLPNMDGFDTLKRIREKDQSTKIIVTSNLSQDEDKQKALALGADDYLVKSDIQLAGLISYIQKITSNEVATDSDRNKSLQPNKS